MRWAFWRRRRAAAQTVAVAPDVVPAPVPAGLAPSRRDEQAEQRPPAAAFSGALPRPAGDDRPLVGIDAARAADLSAVRQDVLDLVAAALAGDRAAAAAVLQRLQDDQAGGIGLVAVAALAALGDRVAVAAGVDPLAEPLDDLEARAVLAQGDTLAGRATSTLSTVAPHCPRELVRLVVRLACGLTELDAAGAHDLDAAPEDLALVAAALLAQSVHDGSGDLSALAAELTGPARTD